jgi:ribosome maturation factor RimP
MADQLKETVAEAVEQKIAGTDIFLVEVKVSPAKVIVLIDKPAGITISECIELTRHLHEVLETSGIFEKHELEVSSPGMEEPLKVLKQYQKRVGREVRVLKTDGIVKTGILKSAGDEGVELEEKIQKKIDKKKVVQINNLQIPFSEIKETKVIFTFK